MADQEHIECNWERTLVNVLEREIEQLRYLDADDSGDTEVSDVHAVMSRVGALADLAYEESFGFSQPTLNELLRLHQIALDVMRARTDKPSPAESKRTDRDQEAAQALYNAIMLNIPSLATGDLSRHALTLSKEAFENLKVYCGNNPGFEVVQRLVRVQDYRAMKLAGDLRQD